MAVLAMAMLTLGACGDDSDESASGLDTIRAGTLTVCSDIPYAPFEFERDGDVVGIDIDLITAVAEGLDLRVSIKDTDFDGIFAALAAGQCDVIASAVSITDERRQNNEFTGGYYDIRQSLLVRKADAERYTSLDTLRGRTIGVQAGTTGEAYAQANAAGATIRSFTGADELFTALRAGQVDGVLQDLPVNAYHAEASGDTAVSVRFSSEPEQYGFVLKKGNTRLRDAINSELSDLVAEGERTRILRRYLGDAAA